VGFVPPPELITSKESACVFPRFVILNPNQSLFVSMVNPDNVPLNVPEELIVTESASEDIVTLVPATRDLNSKSTPTFCAKIPIPGPMFDAVFTSPPPPFPPPPVPLPEVDASPPTPAIHHGQIWSQNWQYVSW